MDNLGLVQYLNQIKILESESIKNALLEIKREDFVIPEFRYHAYGNVALPISEGQTISQPQTVVFMLEKLDLREGDGVLEIGSGSGWVTALMSEIIRDNGAIDAFEINKNIFEFGKNNLFKYKQKNINLYNRSALGYLRESKKKYDRIISGAAFSGSLGLIGEALKNNGIAVIPTQKNSILKIINTKGGLVEENYWGFVFVPMKE